MKSTADRDREDRREAKIMDFVLGTLHSIGSTTLVSMGRVRLPDDNEVRELVRIARTAYDELDRPTESEPVPEKEGSSQPTEDDPSDIVEELFG